MHYLNALFVLHPTPVQKYPCYILELLVEMFEGNFEDKNLMWQLHRSRRCIWFSSR